MRNLVPESAVTSISDHESSSMTIHPADMQQYGLHPLWYSLAAHDYLGPITGWLCLSDLSGFGYWVPMTSTPPVVPPSTIGSQGDGHLCVANGMQDSERRDSYIWWLRQGYHRGPETDWYWDHIGIAAGEAKADAISA